MPTPPVEQTTTAARTSDQAAKTVLRAAFGTAATAWLKKAAQKILAKPGWPDLSFLPDPLTYIADAAARATASLRKLWKGSDWEASLPTYTQNINFRLDGMPKLVWKRTNKILADAQAGHVDIDTARKAVADALDPKLWAPYIDMLAATEANIAVSAARQQHAENAAFKGATVTKTWRSRRDANVRDTHRRADGQTTALGQPFLVGGYPMMHPGDPGAPADQVVNCFPGWTQVATEGTRISWRRWYEGDLIHLQLADGTTLDATPNHPLLHASGVFAPIHTLAPGDHIVRLPHPQPTTTFEQIYWATAAAHIPQQTNGHPADFHGDGTRHPTDTVVIDTTPPPTAPDLSAYGEVLARRAAITRHPANPNPTTVAALTTTPITTSHRTPYTGYVYNLDSGTGWYLANTIVAANCRCVATYDIKERQ